MAIAFRSASSAQTLGATSLVVNKPAGVVDGDVLLMITWVNDPLAQAQFDGLVGGRWNNVDYSSSASSFSNFFAGSKVALGEPASYIVTLNPDTVVAPFMVVILAYSGAVQAGIPWNAVPFSPGYGPGLLAPTDSTYIVTSGDFAVTFVPTDNSANPPATSWTPPSGFTQRISVANAALSLQVSDRRFTTLGNTGQLTTTLGSVSQGVGATFVVLQQPAFYAGLQQRVYFPAHGQVGNVTFPTFPISVPVLGVVGAGAVGLIGSEVFYSRDIGNKKYGWYVPFIGAVPSNVVRVGVNGVEARGVVGRVSAGFDQASAFQPLAFQSNAFQISTAQNVSVIGVSATGFVGVVAFGDLAAVNAYVTGVVGTGLVGTLGSYRVSYPVTGVFGTAVLGLITTPGDMTVNVTGLKGTGRVGALTFQNDMIFTLPRGLYELRGMRGLLGNVQAGASSSNVAVAGVVGTGIVGSVVYESSLQLTGLQVTGIVGNFATRTDGQPVVIGLQAIGRLGAVAFENKYAIAGIQGAGVLGTPLVVIPENVTTGLSVSGGGQVGQVGFIIDCNVRPVGVQARGLLNFDNDIRVDARVAIAGLAAIGQVGTTVEENAYAALGVQGVGRVGVVSPTYAVGGIQGVQGRGQVGVVAIQHDMTVFVTGVTANGKVGTPEFPSLVVLGDRAKMIYTRAPQPR